MTDTAKDTASCPSVTANIPDALSEGPSHIRALEVAPPAGSRPLPLPSPRAGSFPSQGCPQLSHSRRFSRLHSILPFPLHRPLCPVQCHEGWAEPRPQGRLALHTQRSPRDCLAESRWLTVICWRNDSYLFLSLYSCHFLDLGKHSQPSSITASGNSTAHPSGPTSSEKPSLITCTERISLPEVPHVLCRLMAFITRPCVLFLLYSKGKSSYSPSCPSLSTFGSW